MFKKISICLLCCSFLLTSIPFSHATVLNLPQAGTMVNLSPAYQPAIIKGLTIHKDNPFLFDFLVDVGEDNLSGAALKAESEKLSKYFFAALAIPEGDMWVNLSPYEQNKMVPQALGQTDMGRDLLAQDYMLKQVTASLIYPKNDLGKTFWDRVYAKAQQMYGTTQIPLNTFNKVWITADKAEVFEHQQTAFVVNSHLKVMLEEDYLAKQKNNTQKGSSLKAGGDASLTSQIMRDVVIPEIEKEVNVGKNFANLRQVFNSIILAGWYKDNLKQALLNQVYANQSKTKGIDLNDPAVKEQIYQQYIQAYKKGVFNFISNEKEQNSAKEITPRKYFSGGVLVGGKANHPTVGRDPSSLGNIPNHIVQVRVGANISDHAMVVDSQPVVHVGREKHVLTSAIRLLEDLRAGLSKEYFDSLLSDQVERELLADWSKNNSEDSVKANTDQDENQFSLHWDLMIKFQKYLESEEKKLNDLAKGTQVGLEINRKEGIVVVYYDAGTLREKINNLLPKLRLARKSVRNIVAKIPRGIVEFVLLGERVVQKGVAVKTEDFIKALDKKIMVLKAELRSKQINAISHRAVNAGNYEPWMGDYIKKLISGEIALLTAKEKTKQFAGFAVDRRLAPNEIHAIRLTDGSLFFLMGKKDEALTVVYYPTVETPDGTVIRKEELIKNLLKVLEVEPEISFLADFKSPVLLDLYRDWELENKGKPVLLQTHFERFAAFREYCLNLIKSGIIKDDKMQFVQLHAKNKVVEYTMDKVFYFIDRAITEDFPNIIKKYDPIFAETYGYLGGYPALRNSFDDEVVTQILEKRRQIRSVVEKTRASLKEDQINEIKTQLTNPNPVFLDWVGEKIRKDYIQGRLLYPIFQKNSNGDIVESMEGWDGALSRNSGHIKEAYGFKLCDGSYVGIIIVDQAMNIKPGIRPQVREGEMSPGGIDLNTKDMAMKVSRSAEGGVVMNVDPALILRVQREGISQLTPVVLQITTVTKESLRPLLGV